MDVFIIGAGRPARGEKPSGLKSVFHNTNVIDWQLRGFASLQKDISYHFLGGYHVDEVISRYPHLDFTVIPDWDKQSVLYTLLKAPFSKNPATVIYSDTVFHSHVVSDLLRSPADVVVAVDTIWEHRYRLRSKTDMELAEKVSLDDFGLNSKGGVAEFTGLIHFREPAVECLSSMTESDVGTNLVDLIHYLKQQGLQVELVDIEGHWAELNAPEDIARFVLGTKAETLARLEPVVTKSQIGKQINFTTERWTADSSSVLSDISEKFGAAPLVVRSSSKAEDGWNVSSAGKFESYLNVDSTNEEAIREAVNSVISSYKNHDSINDQVLVQEYAENTSLAGVVFARGLETGAPYYRINFDDEAHATDTITSGAHGTVRTIVVSRFDPEYLKIIEPRILPVLYAVQELEQFLGFEKLDIEFALSENGEVYIFQVRPITVDHSDYEVEDETICALLSESVNLFKSKQASPPFVHGDKALFGNMPDWNPAEIIGTKPKPLAFSLYRNLITNDIWAQQRSEFGYRNVQPHPLIVSFCGHPYVDVRASLNSFIPASLPEALAEKLAQAYINILNEKPHLHDKIEFQVAFTIWNPMFMRDAEARLMPHGLSREDITQLGEALKNITRNALERLNNDISSIELLGDRRSAIESSGLSLVGKFVALIDDCRQYGTLAFSHAARSGFVATDLLRSFVSCKIISVDRYQEFLQNIKTVSTDFAHARIALAKGDMSLEQMIEQYGHLRPGTYEIAKRAYWEDPERYLSGNDGQEIQNHDSFVFTRDESEKVSQVLAEMDSGLTAHELCDFLRSAIQQREQTKFEFTRNLSRALDIGVELAGSLSISRDDFAYLDYDDLAQFNLNIIDTAVLKKRIAERKRYHTAAYLVELPSLIRSENDFYCFERSTSQPNFITTKRVIANVLILDNDHDVELKGKIAIIPQADPGFDWLMDCELAGLITMYGGANSHMAIRAAETGLPAAIGVGEKLYENIIQIRNLELDCANQTIREVI